MKERDREERGTGMKGRNRRNKTFSLYPYYKDSRPCPTVSQYQLDARWPKIHDTFATPNHPLEKEKGKWPQLVNLFEVKQQRSCQKLMIAGPAFCLINLIKKCYFLCIETQPDGHSGWNALANPTLWCWTVLAPWPCLHFQRIDTLSGEVALSKLNLPPPEKGPIIRGKNLLSLAVNSFLLEKTPFKKWEGV